MTKPIYEMELHELRRREAELKEELNQITSARNIHNRIEHEERFANYTLSDMALDDIISQPRFTWGRQLTSDDALIYFDTMQGHAEPSWKFMDPKRMLELFDRFEKLPTISAEMLNKIADAREQIEAAR